MKGDKVMSMRELRDRLDDFRDMKHDLDIQMERLKNCEMKMYGVGSPVISDMPKAEGVFGDRISSMVARKLELEDDIKAQLAKRESERVWIEQLIKSLRKSKQRAVIRIRYLDGESWKNVVQIMYGKCEDFDEREGTYRREVFRQHGIALKHMLDAVNKR